MVSLYNQAIRHDSIKCLACSNSAAWLSGREEGRLEVKVVVLRIITVDVYKKESKCIDSWRMKFMNFEVKLDMQKKILSPTCTIYVPNAHYHNSAKCSLSGAGWPGGSKR